jgi:hypothetical protein
MRNAGMAGAGHDEGTGALNVPSNPPGNE